MMSIISCNNSLKNTNIDILICENPAAQKLTDDVREILQPFKKGNTIYLPQGNVFNTSGKLSYVKQKGWMDKIRGNITKNTSFLILKEKISNYLKELDISRLKLKEPLNINELSNLSANYNVVLGFSTNSSISTTSYAFKLFTNTTNLTNYIRDSILVNSPEAKILIVYNPTFTDQSNYRDTGTIMSSSDNEPLRLELLKIIDTKRSRREREEVAQNVWDEYFSPEVYVDNLMDENDKNPEHWSPGNGKSYFAHLVTLPSIIDIKILTVERDKETQKISGLRVCEIRNGSKINRKINL